MSAPKKNYEEKYQNIWVGLRPIMIGDLDKIAIMNGISRNEVIRLASDFLLKNKKKFNLK